MRTRSSQRTHGMAMEGTRRVAAHSDIAVETLVLVSQEMARQLVTEPIARGGMRLTMEIGSIQGPIEQPYLDWIEAIKQVATQAAEAGDIVPGTDIDALARFVVRSFTGVQILSEMLTGRTDLYERLSQMWEPGAANDRPRGQVGARHATGGACTERVGSTGALDVVDATRRTCSFPLMIGPQL